MAAACLCLLSVSVAGAASPKRPPPASTGSYIVVFHNSVGDPSGATTKLERKGGFKAKYRYSRALKGFAGHLSDKQLATVENDPGVAFVSPDRPVKALATLAPGETAPSGVRRMGAASGSTVRGASSVNVAVIDTGIDLGNAELNAATGTNCISPGSAPQDDNGHGTHVSGTIAARNTGSGVIGVAPGTKLYAVKVLDAAGSGTQSQVICGIDWTAATRTDGNSTNDISVANMSLGGSTSPFDALLLQRRPHADRL